MIEVDQYKDIRRYYVEEGLSERAIAKLMGVSRNTVRKYKDGAVLPGQRKTAVRQSPVTGPIRETVDRYPRRGPRRSGQAEADSQTHLDQAASRTRFSRCVLYR